MSEYHYPESSAYRPTYELGELSVTQIVALTDDLNAAFVGTRWEGLREPGDDDDALTRAETALTSDLRHLAYTNRAKGMAVVRALTARSELAWDHPAVRLTESGELAWDYPVVRDDRLSRAAEMLPHLSAESGDQTRLSQAESEELWSMWVDLLLLLGPRALFMVERSTEEALDRDLVPAHVFWNVLSSMQELLSNFDVPQSIIQQIRRRDEDTE